VGQRQLLQTDDAVLLHEGLHQEAIHVGRVLVELEELPVVAQREGLAHLEGVVDALLLLLVLAQFLQRAQRLRLQSDEDLVEQFVGEELDARPLDLALEKVVQLRLALVELVQVRLLQGDARVCLIDLHGRRGLDALHSQVLPHRAELLVDVAVVGLFSLPLPTDQFERPLQHLLGAHVSWVNLRSDAEVRLL